MLAGEGSTDPNPFNLGSQKELLKRRSQFGSLFKGADKRI